MPAGLKVSGVKVSVFSGVGVRVWEFMRAGVGGCRVWTKHPPTLVCVCVLASGFRVLIMLKRRNGNP